MKCHRQPKFLQERQVKIASVIEVRLAPRQWNRIKIAVWHRRRTYSTITRFCVMKLARKCSLRWTARLLSARQSVKRGMEIAEDTHRHMMCLYGEDEKVIRLAAMDLGVTISAFVRLAIELYLHALAMENHSRSRVSNSDLTAEGIRFTQEVQIYATNGGPYPYLRTLSCIPFNLDSYW